MRAVFSLMLDTLREAAARRWFFAFAVVLTLLILALVLGLRMDVVDGALAATRLFGNDVSHDVRSADVALRSVFEAATYAVFYGGLCFGVLACSDFGPELLSPGRIEHLLSLPIRRVELLLGTFLGVMALCLLGIAYGAGGFFLVLCAKAQLWTLRPLLGASLAMVAFFAVYACMLSCAVFVQSASLCAAAGGLCLLAGVVAGQREALAALLEPGFGRQALLVVLAPLPRVSELGEAAASIAIGGAAPESLWRLVTGTLLFGLSVLAVGAWRLRDKDF